MHVPYFFSDVFDLSYEYWGGHVGADEVAYRGSVDSGRFSVWWTKAGRLIAAFVLNRPNEERELAPRWVERHQQINPGMLENASQPLREQASAVRE